MFAIAEDVRNEFVLKVTGKVRRRPAGTENSNIRTGEIEMLCHELEILNASVTPPFQLDDDNLSETTRLTHRVLDLRRPQMQKNLMLRYRGRDGGSQLPRHLGFHRHRNADADQVDARGRARLPGALARATRAVLRAAAVAAIVQANADGGGL